MNDETNERNYMAGNKEGGKKAALRNKELHGEDFYARIGGTGGRAKNPNKGFGSMTPEQRIEAGRKGGAKSRRGNANKNNNTEDTQEED